MSEKIVLTDKIKEELQGLCPFSNDATVEYTPAAFNRPEIPVEFRPVFKLRPFTKPEKIRVSDLMKKIADEEAGLTEMSRMITLGWEKLFDSATGQEIVYQADPKGGCDKALFDTMTSTIKGGILFKCWKISGLVSMDAIGLK